MDVFFIIRTCDIHGGKNNYNNGVYFDNVANGKIDNTASVNNWNGINLIFSSNNIIVNCIASYEGYSGISLDSLENNIIINCTASNNQLGIYLRTSSNNVITNNAVENNVYGGFFVFYSCNNVITNFTVKNNEHGIQLLEYSDNNHIHQNNFVNNADQAYDNGSNYWDNGYPSGGNYWSNYSGTDYRRGENQNISGSDGIWDTPYYIAGGSNFDRYPLRELSLVRGWNLVGFAGTCANDTPTNLFTGLNYYTDYYLYWWTAPGGPYNIQDPDTAFKDDLGYWVFIPQNKTVTVP